VVCCAVVGLLDGDHARRLILRGRCRRAGEQHSASPPAPRRLAGATLPGGVRPLYVILSLLYDTSEGGIPPRQRAIDNLPSVGDARRAQIVSAGADRPRCGRRASRKAPLRTRRSLGMSAALARHRPDSVSGRLPASTRICPEATPTSNVDSMMVLRPRRGADRSKLVTLREVGCGGHPFSEVSQSRSLGRPFYAATDKTGLPIIAEEDRTQACRQGW